MILAIKIKDIKVSESQKVVNQTYDGKGVRFDVYLEDNTNSVYDIEMQTTLQKDLGKRTRYYQGMIDLNLIEKGEAYDILNTSYVIFICTFDFFESNKSMYEFENICINRPELKLNDGTHKIFLNTKGDRSGISKELKLLLDYFDGKEPESKLAKKIDQKVFEAKRNDQWRREYMSYQMELNQQYRNGKEEGRKEGIDDMSKLIKMLI